MNVRILINLATFGLYWARPAQTLPVVTHPDIEPSGCEIGAWLDDVAATDVGSIVRLSAAQRAHLSDVSGRFPHGISVLADPKAIWVASSLADCIDSARFLVFVDDPVSSLADAITAGDVEDPLAWIATWIEAAKHLIRFAHTWPQRCCFVELEDLCCDPDAVSYAAGFKLGLSGLQIATQRQTSAAHDLISQSLAFRCCASSEMVESLYAELKASCLPRSGSPGLYPLVNKLPQYDSTAAISLYRELLAARSAKARLQTVEAELDTAQADVEACRATIVDIERGHAQDLKEQDSRRQAQRDHLTSLLRLQLQQAKEEVDNLTEACSEQRSSASRSESAFLGKIDDLEDKQSILNNELHESKLIVSQQRAAYEVLASKESALRDEHQSLAVRLSEHQQMHTAVVEQFERDQRDARLKDDSLLHLMLNQAREEVEAKQRVLDENMRREVSLRQKSEQLQLQVRQLQVSADRLDQENRTLQVDAGRVALGSGVSMSITDIRYLAERTTPPHLELSLDLRGVKIDGRSVDQMSVRLVAHNGHPGLVVFEPTHGVSLFTQWQANGSEDGRPYMLLIPADGISQSLLRLFSASDWSALQGLVGHIEHRLHDGLEKADRSWCHIARRLREELQEIPAHFRYDSAVVDSIEDGSMLIHFRRVSFGARNMPALDARWTPGGKQSEICLLVDSNVGPPLSYWPVDSKGSQVDHLILPLKSVSGSTDAYRRWAALRPADRSFVFAMLSVWPEAAIHAAHAARVYSGLDSGPLVVAARRVAAESGWSLMRLGRFMRQSASRILKRKQ